MRTSPKLTVSRGARRLLDGLAEPVLTVDLLVEFS
jgi:hypothetical protein